MDVITTKNFQLALYRKGNEDSEKVVLCLPGRLDTKDYAHMRSHVDYFADKGYFAVSFDPPGTWESPGDIELYTMTNYLKAINEVIEYFGNKPTVVVGHSRGGSTALLASVKNDYVTHVVSLMGRGNYGKSTYPEWKEKGYNDDYRDLPPGSHVKEKKFTLQYSFVEDSQKYDVQDLLSVSTKPVLFVAGSKDVLASMEVMKEAYDNAGEPKEFCVVESDHDYRYHPTLIEEINGIVEKFLTKYKF